MSIYPTVKVYYWDNVDGGGARSRINTQMTVSVEIDEVRAKKSEAAGILPRVRFELTTSRI